MVTNNLMAEQRLETLHQRRAQAIAAINKVANRTPMPEGRFKEGDQVWLEASNLKLPYHTPKLTPRRQGPFRINEVISPVAYQLTLPPSWGICYDHGSGLPRTIFFSLSNLSTFYLTA